MSDDFSDQHGDQRGARWSTAIERLVRSLADLGEDRVLSLEPDGRHRWSQVVRKGRTYLAEVQSNAYLEGTGLEWDDQQQDKLHALDWRRPSITPEQADSGATGSPNHHASFGLEEAFDLARVLVAVYRDITPIETGHPLWACASGARTDLLAAVETASSLTGRPAAGHSYASFAKQDVSCPDCGWAGPGNAATVRAAFDGGAELECPRCSAYFGFAGY